MVKELVNEDTSMKWVRSVGFQSNRRCYVPEEKTFLNNRVTNWLTNQIHGAVFPQNLKVTNLPSIFLVHYATWRFIFAITRARHFVLSLAKQIHFTPQWTIYLRYFLIIFFHLSLYLPICPFPLGSSNNIIMCSSLMNEYSHETPL